MINEGVPRLAITPGEPSGIGPDLCILAAQKNYPCELVAFADPDLLKARARRLNAALDIISVEPNSNPGHHLAGRLHVIPIRLHEQAEAGNLNSRNAGYVLKTITRGVRRCLEGRADALVTGPVHKGIINDAGIAFTGHTEFISDITGGQPVMMLAAPGLRVALVTTHIALKDVSAAINRQRIKTVLTTLNRDLAVKFNIDNPRILVCGLNPHAGESGHLGQEEIEVIEPTIKSLQKHGLNLRGPMPADTVFTPKNLENADAILAMYHDQGLPVLKSMGFGNSVNITLGLPIIRTSVDHGTALDLAGTGNIDTGSLEAALETAIVLARNNRATV